MPQSRFPAGKLPHEVLDRLINTYPKSDPRLIVPPSVGEDAAVIEMGTAGGRYLVAKTDPITFATDAIGWYAVHVNANDIAAMGATPRFFLATIIVPQEQSSEQTIAAIFNSIGEAAGELGITVCGGHTEITHGIDRPIVVGQMLGEVEQDRLVRSSGLLPGDSLILTKGLAIEATAIIAREKRQQLLERGYGDEFLDECAGFLTNPGISVVRDAQIAVEAGTVSAMHDPTEGGVATGLRELALASEVGLEIDAGALYIAPESEALCTEFDLDPLGAISSGSLLIGCRKESAQGILAHLADAGIRAAIIGSVLPFGAGLQMQKDGEISPLPRFSADEITRLFETQSE